jgi:hypothetical protein
MKGFIARPVLAALLALAGAIFQGCGEEERNLKRRIVYHPNSKNIRTEWIVDVKPNGDTALHGAVKDYYWGGGSRKSVVWADGVRDGSAQAWYENGDQMWQKNYVKGRKDGTWRLFYSDGKPWMVMTFDKEGKLEGEVKRWGRDSENPDVAAFSAGACASGNCNILALPEVPEEASTAEKKLIAKDLEILVEFLD